MGKKIIFGIGNAGCKIAMQMAQYRKFYDIYLADTEIELDKVQNDDVVKLRIPKCQTVEKCEEEIEKNYKLWKSDVKKEDTVYMIVAGGGVVSSSTLVFMEKFQAAGKKYIIYIQPDMESLSPIKRLAARATFAILQEYARSGLLTGIILYDNVLMEREISPLQKNVKISDYYDPINNMIMSTLHSWIIFSCGAPVFGDISPSLDHARIISLSYINPDNWKDEKTDTFALEYIDEAIYFIGLRKDSGMDRVVEYKSKVRELFKEKKYTTTYGIFELPYDHDYLLVEKRSRKTQY